MKRNRIRINEAQLHNVIKESVRRVLKEEFDNEEMPLDEEIHEGFFRNMYNGARDIYHNLTDNQDQLRNYNNRRNYEDAQYAQQNRQQLSNRQQRTLDKGNQLLQQRKNASQRRYNNAVSNYVASMENPDTKAYDRQRARDKYQQASQRNYRIQNMTNPHR